MRDSEEPALGTSVVEPEDRRVCSRCGDSKALSLFRGDTPRQKRCTCRYCYNARRRELRAERGTPKRTARERKRDNESRKRRRQDPARRAFHICQDSRINDRKRGRANDLEIEFVEGLINQGCSYCGISRKDAPYMTLDRMDNQLGHLKSNVVPSCLSCNLTRGTMPYEAWCLAAEGLRKARSLGLLDGWAVNQHLKRRMGQ